MRTLRTFLLGAVGVAFMLAVLRGFGVSLLRQTGDVFGGLLVPEPFLSLLGITIGVLFVLIGALSFPVVYFTGRAILEIGGWIEKQWRDLQTRK